MDAGLKQADSYLRNKKEIQTALSQNLKEDIRILFLPTVVEKWTKLCSYGNKKCIIGNRDIL